MPYDLYYSMLFTNQGMGNLISITNNGSTEVQFSALIDFGAQDMRLATETIAFMVLYIQRNRGFNKPGPDLDLVVVSHQDSDHWNLFNQLIEKIAETGHPLTIGSLAYGGLWINYKAKAKNTIIKLRELAAVNIEMPESVCSSYSALGTTAQLGPLAQYPVNNPEVRFKTVICNAPSPRGSKPDIVNNTVSLMVAVEYLVGNNWVTAVLLPGDLTANTILGLFKYRQWVDVLKSTKVLGLPHHGSHRTLADGCLSDINHRKFIAATWFADFIKPNALAVSAGFTSHKHPYLFVIDLFDYTVEMDEDEHTFVAYDQEEGIYDVYDTQDAIYTNYSSLTPAFQQGKREKNIATTAQDGDPGRIVFHIKPNGDMEITDFNPAFPPNPAIL